MSHNPRISPLLAVAVAVGITGLTLACGADAPPAPEPNSVGSNTPETGAEFGPEPGPSVTPSSVPHDTPAVEDEDAVEEEPVAAAPDPGVEEELAEASSEGPWSLGDEVSIKRMALAESNEKRLPVGEGDRFPEGHRVQLFIEASNRGGRETTVSVAWENTANGRRSPATSVRIGKGKIYRTRAYRTMRRAGSYRAVVSNAEGLEIASLPFTIVEASS